MFPIHIVLLASLVSLLILSPSLARFGVAGGKRRATSFQELNDLAQQQELQQQKEQALRQPNAAAAAAGMQDLLGNMDKVQEMWDKLLKSPQGDDAMNLWGDKMNEAMAELSKMTPEQLQKQMQDALAMLTKDDMVDAVVSQRDEILKTLQDSHLVSDDELAKYKENPEYFELKMRESFDQMKDVFNKPEIMQAALDGMTKFQQAMADPGKFYGELAKSLQSELNSDEKIEEARLKLIANPDVADNPLLGAVFKTDEMQEILKDPVKWRTSVKEGQGLLNRDGIGAGAGIGEL